MAVACGKGKARKQKFLEDDRTVHPANSINYYMALISRGVPAAMHIYPTGGHGWGFRDRFPYKREWTGELEKWLREQVL